ncbi:hypothetical protein L7F22_039877 [Adiantum nelumboides]|nr:hypothetical protein [Adiantum nelumboides]
MDTHQTFLIFASLEARPTPLTHSLSRSLLRKLKKESLSATEIDLVLRLIAFISQNITAQHQPETAPSIAHSSTEPLPGASSTRPLSRPSSLQIAGAISSPPTALQSALGTNGALSPPPIPAGVAHIPAAPLNSAGKPLLQPIPRPYSLNLAAKIPSPFSSHNGASLPAAINSAESVQPYQPSPTTSAPKALCAQPAHSSPSTTFSVESHPHTHSALPINSESYLNIQPSINSFFKPPTPLSCSRQPSLNSHQLSSPEMARIKYTVRMSSAPHRACFALASTQHWMKFDASTSRASQANRSPQVNIKRPVYLASPPSPRPDYTLCHYSLPSGVDEVESQASSSATSPNRPTSQCSSSPPSKEDSTAESPPLRMRSLNDIYEATCFASILEEEQVSEVVLDILEDKIGPTIEDALTSSEATSWQEAIDVELNALNANQTWVLVPRPANTNVVSCKWLLKKKFNLDGTGDKYKARLVAHDFSQRQGIDYNETYSPVLGMASFRLLVRLAAKFNLPLHHIDIKTAFLHGHLHENIFMSQLPHFESDAYPDYVCRLKRLIMDLNNHLANGINACTLS